MSTHIRIVTPITTRGFRDRAEFKALEGTELRISCCDIKMGPASIECELDEALALPGTIARVIEAQRDGAQAVVIDCMGDPGMKAARECVNIPVIGPCQVSMHVAAILGQRFSVLTVLDRVGPMIENLARQYGVAAEMASVRSVNIPVLELERNLEGTRTALGELAVRAVEADGADAIVLGCTGMLGGADAVRESLFARNCDVPVIDPVPLAVRMAAALIDCGLSHSKVTFAQPPLKPVVGYEALELGREAARPSLSG